MKYALSSVPKILPSSNIHNAVWQNVNMMHCVPNGYIEYLTLCYSMYCQVLCAEVRVVSCWHYNYIEGKWCPVKQTIGSKLQDLDFSSQSSFTNLCLKKLILMNSSANRSDSRLVHGSECNFPVNFRDFS